MTLTIIQWGCVALALVATHFVAYSQGKQWGLRYHMAALDSMSKDLRAPGVSDTRKDTGK